MPRAGWKRTDRRTGSATSARDTVGCNEVVKRNDTGMDSRQRNALPPVPSVVLMKKTSLDAKAPRLMQNPRPTTVEPTPLTEREACVFSAVLRSGCADPLE